MRAEETGERFADERPGFDLLDYAEVGLPYWRVRARCDVLDHKQISAINEAILRAIDIGVDRPADIAVLLGLEDVVLDTTVLDLLGKLDPIGRR
jgi:hypothetical protein